MHTHDLSHVTRSNLVECSCILAESARSAMCPAIPVCVKAFRVHSKNNGSYIIAVVCGWTAYDGMLPSCNGTPVFFFFEFLYCCCLLMFFQCFHFCNKVLFVVLCVSWRAYTLDIVTQVAIGFNQCTCWAVQSFTSHLMMSQQGMTSIISFVAPTTD